MADAAKTNPAGTQSSSPTMSLPHSPHGSKRRRPSTPEAEADADKVDHNPKRTKVVSPPKEAPKEKEKGKE
jgi:hypothetical protein